MNDKSCAQMILDFFLREVSNIAYATYFRQNKWINVHQTLLKALLFTWENMTSWCHTIGCHVISKHN